MKRFFRLSVTVIALLALFFSAACQSGTFNSSEQSSVFWPSASDTQNPKQSPDVSFRTEYLDALKKVSMLPAEPVDCVTIDDSVAYCPLNYDSNAINFQYLYPYISDCSVPVNIDLGNDGSIETLCYIGKVGLLIYRDGELIDLLNIKVSYLDETTEPQKISDIYVLDRDSENGVYGFLVIFSSHPCRTTEEVAEIFYDSQSNIVLRDGMRCSYFEYDINEASPDSLRSIVLDRFDFYDVVGTDGYTLNSIIYSELLGMRKMVLTGPVKFYSRPSVSELTFPTGSKITYEIYLSNDVSFYTRSDSGPQTSYVSLRCAGSSITLIGEDDGIFITSDSLLGESIVSYVFKDELADSISAAVGITGGIYSHPDPYGFVRPFEYALLNMSFKCKKLIADDTFESCTVEKGTWLCPIETDMSSYVLFRDLQGNTYHADLKIEDKPVSVYVPFLRPGEFYDDDRYVSFTKSYFINGTEQTELFYYPGYHHFLFYADNAEFRPIGSNNVR